MRIWLESIALAAFGVAWFTNGELILADLKSGGRVRNSEDARWSVGFILCDGSAVSLFITSRILINAKFPQTPYLDVLTAYWATAKAAA